MDPAASYTRRRCKRDTKGGARPLVQLPLTRYRPCTVMPYPELYSICIHHRTHASMPKETQTLTPSIPMPCQPTTWITRHQKRRGCCYCVSARSGAKAAGHAESLSRLAALHARNAAIAQAYYVASQPAGTTANAPLPSAALTQRWYRQRAALRPAPSAVAPYGSVHALGPIMGVL